MISFTEADHLIFHSLKKIIKQSESIHILDANNRILAEDVFADTDMPPFDNSAMDGYAINNINNKNGWQITGEIKAGIGNEFKLLTNNCLSIMTGAMVPENCDGIIPVEDTDMNDNKIYLKQDVTVTQNAHIRKQGNDVKKGKTVLKKGTLLTPKETAILGTFGKRLLSVYKKIKIGLIQTGNELIDIGDIPKNDKIRNSNYYTILNSISDMNAIPVPFGIVKDNEEEINSKIKEALRSDIDILITSGGISAGKYDLVKKAYADNGIVIKIDKVNIKPGKPFTYGEYKTAKKFIAAAGLPGNPVSCLVNFILFIKRNIYKNAGIISNPVINAVLERELDKMDNKRHFLMGRLKFDENDYAFAYPAISQSSGNLTELGNSNCLIIMEEDKTKFKKGDTIKCMMI